MAIFVRMVLSDKFEIFSTGSSRYDSSTSTIVGTIVQEMLYWAINITSMHLGTKDIDTCRTATDKYNWHIFRYKGR